MFAKFAMVALLIAYGTTDDDGMWCMLAKLFITRNNLRWDNAFATFILFRRKISFSNPELFFHFARCTKDTLKCISMFFEFSNDIRKGGIFIDF